MSRTRSLSPSSGPRRFVLDCLAITMLTRRNLLTLGALLPVFGRAEQSYRVYTEHPRLWLTPRRLKLLKRERERESIRWQQLGLLVPDRQAPELALLRALEFQVADRPEAGKLAVEWALGRTPQTTPDPAQLRLLAVVFDWCYPLLEAVDRARLAGRMARGIQAPAAGSGLASFSAAALAAIALADDWPGSEQALATAFEKKWPETYLPAFRQGRAIPTPAERVAFLELCHALRDNLHLDLWQQAPAFFRQFPLYLLLSYYPAPVTIASHPFRQTAAAPGSQPDPAMEGELARRTDLLTVAYETNSVETQFLQGWITHDLYRLRMPSAAPYEFLWMNPYQPGLSYHAVPLYLHDEIGGTLLARSSWDDDAAWVGYRDRKLELFADSERSGVEPSAKPAPVVFQQLAVAAASGEAAFAVRVIEGEDVFVVGLEPGNTYWVRSGQSGFVPLEAGKGGILRLRAELGSQTEFEIKTADPAPPPPPPTPQRKRKK